MGAYEVLQTPGRSGYRGLPSVVRKRSINQNKEKELAKMAKVQFNTVQGFPSKGVDAEIATLGELAMKDGQVRVGPDHADTRQLLASLRTWCNSQNRKLKTRTVNGQIYWQITNEAPKKRSATAATNGQTAPPVAAVR